MRSNSCFGARIFTKILRGSALFTDYTTAKNADRRGTFLKAATALLIEHLESLVKEWAPGQKDNYRATFLALPPEDALKKMLTGISMLSGFELSGERMMVACDTQDQEDEHSCFSDTTHNDIIYNALGIANAYNGTYKTSDGKEISGPRLSTLLETTQKEDAAALSRAIAAAVTACKAIPVPFDQALIGDDKAPGRKAILAAVEKLEDVADLTVKISKRLGFEVPVKEVEE